MSRTTNNFKLGLFTLGGVSLLVLGILAFGARSYFESTSSFETYVEGDVSGLSVGSPVVLRGVRVGKVKRIDFSWNEYQETQPSYIVVEFEMRDNVTPLPPGDVRTAKIETAIRRGLRARLKSQGITGTSILSLEYLNPIENPPAEVPWTPKHTYIPAAPSQFSELLASIERSLRTIERLDFASISELLQGERTGVRGLCLSPRRSRPPLILPRTVGLICILAAVCQGCLSRPHLNKQSFIFNAPTIPATSGASSGRTLAIRTPANRSPV